VIAYTLIVAEDDSKNSTGLEMPSWADVQAYTIWPPYQVISNDSSIKQFFVFTTLCIIISII